MDVSPDQSDAAPRTPRPPWVVWLSVAAAIVLVAGGFFVAKAMAGSASGSSTATGGAPANGSANTNGNNGQGRGPGTSGTIMSISGDTLTVKDTATNSTVSVTTSSSTRVTLAQSVAVGSVVKGDRIFVTGTTSGNSVDATTISDLGSSTSNLPTGGGGGPAGRTPGEGGGGGANAPPGGQRAGGGLTTGTVSSVTSGTIVVSAADGSTTTVKTSTSTTVTKSVAGSVKSLKIGDSVRVVGTTGNGSVAATTITEGDSGFGGFGGGNRPPGATGAGA
jgi:hypothetical protein